jgi:hypothetical protein
MPSFISRQVFSYSVRLFTVLFQFSIMLITFICLQIIFQDSIKTALLIVEHSFKQVLSHLVTESL